MSHQDKIKLFLKAKTPEALQILMLRNSTERSAYFDYKVMFVSGFWYAWFEGEASDFLTQEAKKLELLRPNTNG